MVPEVVGGGVGVDAVDHCDAVDDLGVVLSVATDAGGVGSFLHRCSAESYRDKGEFTITVNSHKEFKITKNPH